MAINRKRSKGDVVSALEANSSSDSGRKKGKDGFAQTIQEAVKDYITKYLLTREHNKDDIKNVAGVGGENLEEYSKDYCLGYEYTKSQPADKSKNKRTIDGKPVNVKLRKVSKDVEYSEQNGNNRIR